MPIWFPFFDACKLQKQGLSVQDKAKATAKTKSKLYLSVFKDFMFSVSLEHQGSYPRKPL